MPSRKSGYWTISALYVLEAVMYAVKSDQTRSKNQRKPTTMEQAHHLSLFVKKPSTTAYQKI